jgi:protein-L-isoaspartate(D-aspartate) O-methyltransferase
MLDAMLEKRLAYAAEDGRRFLDAVSNARLLTNAERYYREMYRGTVSSWNLRDRHMFDSLQSLLEYHGENSKGIVWAHNSHLGDASATDMGVRGEFNLGQLCREAYGRQAYRLGFGTHTGTVAAASHWGGEMEIKRVRPSLPESYEHCCHESGPEAFLLPLRDTDADHVRALRRARLERAIGVIYRPETERASHYFKAALPRQFDEYAWFDETRAVDPLTPGPGTGTRATWPFGV